jgi:NifB/MoaA-like Fe-S oxidoreductase
MEFNSDQVIVIAKEVFGENYDFKLNAKYGKFVNVIRQLERKEAQREISELSERVHKLEKEFPEFEVVMTRKSPEATYNESKKAKIKNILKSDKRFIIVLDEWS